MKLAHALGRHRGLAALLSGEELLQRRPEYDGMDGHAEQATDPAQATAKRGLDPGRVEHDEATVAKERERAGDCLRDHLPAIGVRVGADCLQAHALGVRELAANP